MAFTTVIQQKLGENEFSFKNDIQYNDHKRGYCATLNLRFFFFFLSFSDSTEKRSLKALIHKYEFA